MKNYYFISDAHLGCKAFEHRRTKERRLVNFLDAIKDKAEAVLFALELQFSKRFFSIPMSKTPLFPTVNVVSTGLPP